MTARPCQRAIAARSSVRQVTGPDFQVGTRDDLGWVTGVMAYVKHIPEVKAQLLTKQRVIKEERSRRKQVTGPDFQVVPRERLWMGDRCDGTGGPGRQGDGGPAVQEQVPSAGLRQTLPRGQGPVADKAEGE